MCGIFGGAPQLLMSDPTALLLHRGPDQNGIAKLQDAQGRALMIGMTRLSIVSRRDLDLPLMARGAVIAFNGEIYNWRELRDELTRKGIRFRTETDIEVALNAYLEWGPACLDRFNGMFALAIWHEGTLFLARDRLGKKPLFYVAGAAGLAFASEIKAFATLEFDPVDLCERLEFYFDEHTPFRNVRSVKPGEYLIWNSRDDSVTTRSWWSFPEDVEGSLTELGPALREFLPLFEDACRLRRLADAPVTMFLSGGIDSSLIQAVLKLERTYTVQFEEFAATIDERSLVEEFARHLGFEARIVRPNKEDFLAAFPSLARHIEFPVGSFSIYPLYCLSRAARADGFKVALSGEGADELFNGYYRNELLLEEDTMVRRHQAGPYRHLATRYFGGRLDRFAAMASRHEAADLPQLVELFRPHWREHRDFEHNISAVETEIFLQALLVMADRMSMAHGLEVRNPFLDHRIVSFSARLAPHLRYRDGRGKYLLRAALREILGDDSLGIVRRQVKHGLPAPVNNWFFKSNSFDRRDWNAMMLGECLRQMQMRAGPP